MARIRTIKPEFWTAEQVMECSPMARLLFIGMWNFCDDGGVHPASAKTLKAEVFPSDDITAGQVEVLVLELVANDLLLEYEAGGKRYLHVTGWSRHQKIEKPNFKHPGPDSATPRRPVVEQSPNDLRPVADQSTPEWSRSGVGIGNGEDKNLPPSSVVANSSEVAREKQTPAALPAESRRGTVCRLLRASGVSDAAPHHLTDDTWAQILAKRTDEEIVEFAKAKLESRPGQRTGLKYLAPGLLEDPTPIATPTAGARASPGRMSRDESRAIAASTRLSDFRAACAADANQGQNDERTIEAPTAPRQLG